MKYYPKWIIVFFLLSLGTSLSAQFQCLSKKQGLSQASVFSIAQDSTGFLWFGTRDGLNKYDGTQFKVYKSNASSNSLVANDIRSLYVDPDDGAIWIGTISGLSRYEPATDNFVNYVHAKDDETSLSPNVVRTIYKDSKGRLWIGTSAGLNLYRKESNDFLRFDFNIRPKSNGGRQDVKTIIEDFSGTLWIGTSNGLYRLIDSDVGSYTFEIVNGANGCNLSDINIVEIVVADNDNLWIGTNNGGVNYWDRKIGRTISYSSMKNNEGALSHNNIRSMCLDRHGNLWVGTFDGLNFLKKGKSVFTKYRKLNDGISGLSDESIHSVFIDQQNGLWVGTYYGGINHLDENYNRFFNYKHTLAGNTLSEDVVSSFAEDENGNWWIGTEGGGLNYYNKESEDFNNYQFSPGQSNGLSGNNVKQLLLDGDHLWIGTFQAGLNLFDIKNEKFTHYENNPNDATTLANNNVYGLKKVGNYLWILTYGGGVDIFDRTTNIFHHFGGNSIGKKSLSSDLTRVILECANGQLWIGTEHGLNKVLLGDTGFPVGYEVFLADKKIYTLQEDYKNNIWIGTLSNGLFCLNPKDNSIIHFTESDGLPSNTVFGILEANDDELWLSTNNGLSKFNTKLKVFTNYNYSNGLENSEYNFNAYYKTATGDFLFGGINGFTQFQPSSIQSNRYVPPIVFTELKQNNKIVQVYGEDNTTPQGINDAKEISFNYNEANFNISFAALDYISPENNRYAFMLEGLDREWNYITGIGEASYTIQKEGDYIFRIKGSNSDGIWNPSERNLKITVLPPAWRTWWAYLAYFMLLLAGIIGFLWFVKLRHKLQLQHISKKQQEELYEVKLRFFTNITHEFRTPLTLIIGPLKELINKEQHSKNVSGQLSLIERNAQRLLNLVNQILTFRKLATDHVPMKVINGNLVTFLKEIFLFFKESANLRNIQYSFKVETSVINVWYDQDKLEKVFYNLLSNAFKFAPDNGYIEMVVSSDGDNIEVRIKDNGVGVDPALKELIFKRFYEKANADRLTAKGSGIGLAISKQMVELHKGQIYVEKKSSSSLKGATFVVQFPLGNDHFKKEEIIENFNDVENVKDYTPLIPHQSTDDITYSSRLSTLPEDAPLLLIVEDNADVQTYIKHVFSNEYRIICAGNGVEGLKKAKTKLPDLIISDVMMPEMDGITFCEKLKANIEISHIPIVLLTARTASIFKIEGLKIGADDYITKPFNPEELRLRVRNIIQARQEVRDKFIRILSFDPKEINITSADEYFLENALSTVEDNIGNYEFNVIQFASDLAVSRPLLFTKLKALTGQTPNNFIKTIRLKRAAQLLKSQKLNVSEITYKVGFKDPKYFRKCFQKQFGMLPSQYGK